MLVEVEVLVALVVFVVVVVVVVVVFFFFLAFVLLFLDGVLPRLRLRLVAGLVDGLVDEDVDDDSFLPMYLYESDGCATCTTSRQRLVAAFGDPEAAALLEGAGI